MTNTKLIATRVLSIKINIRNIRNEHAIYGIFNLSMELEEHKRLRSMIKQIIIYPISDIGTSST